MLFSYSVHETIDTRINREPLHNVFALLSTTLLPPTHIKFCFIHCASDVTAVADQDHVIQVPPRPDPTFKNKKPDPDPVKMLKTGGPVNFKRKNIGHDTT